ncbi:WBSCR27 [Branchiostoma lanceolatum]|uniref:WBSCR27 protein n=1 Tax=Branchiostoma lanceolatum TaxID=7740 RepID=A0A8J9VF81_BRALA|nr:WBSCR27 [Branchiostoma lanceolatum]
MDALDANDNMLALAKEKNVYGRLIQDFLGTNRLDVEDGGFVVISMREVNLRKVPEYRNLEPRMAALQSEGCWEQVSRDMFPDYCEGEEGIMFVYRVC